MPELPEVEGYRRYFNRYALRKPIRDVARWDPRLFPGWNASEIRLRLLGKSFVRTERRGKYLIAYVDAEQSVVLHFGMTGALRFHRSAGEIPRHARASILFETGALFFTDLRRFGGIWWVESLGNFPRVQQLGDDPISGIIDTAETLAAKMAGWYGWMDFPRRVMRTVFPVKIHSKLRNAE